MAAPILTPLLSGAACAGAVLLAGPAMHAVRAGVGETPLSGYAVSQVDFQYSSDAAAVTGIAFRLDRAAKVVRVALGPDATDTDWQDCRATGTAPYRVVCQLDRPIPIARANRLAVLAHG